MDRGAQKNKGETVSDNLCRLITQTGAEAVLRLAEFDGRECVLKERVKKGYRIRELDEKLRCQRTRAESKITGEARRGGVNVPAVLCTDEKNHLIYFELINGPTLKEFADRMPARKPFEEWGAAVAKLHSAGITHGDLTTSNAMLSGRVYLIDFGLSFFSKREEDQAEDINLLRQSLRATHSSNFGTLWKSFIKGYSAYSKSGGVIRRAEKIASRGRYVSRKALKITDA